MLRRLLSGEELNELYLEHLMVLARQPFSDELMGMVKDILEKTSLTNELSDEQLKLRGKMIFTVLNGFSQEMMAHRVITTCTSLNLPFLLKPKSLRRNFLYYDE